jgi:hypothetical protein
MSPRGSFFGVCYLWVSTEGKLEKCSIWRLMMTLLLLWGCEFLHLLTKKRECHQVGSPAATQRWFLKRTRKWQSGIWLTTTSLYHISLFLVFQPPLSFTSLLVNEHTWDGLTVFCQPTAKIQHKGSPNKNLQEGRRFFLPSLLLSACLKAPNSILFLEELASP